MGNILEIKNLSKKYDDFALDNVNITLPKGSIMGFIGENGAGKSTTIKLILNLIHRDSGKISIFGWDNIEYENKIKEDIGVVFALAFAIYLIAPGILGTEGCLHIETRRLDIGEHHHRRPFGYGHAGG